MRPRLLISLALATVCLGARAEWVRVAENPQSVFYLDPALSARMGDNVTVWLLREHRERRFGEGGPYVSSRDQIEIDCRARRVRRIYSSDHPRPMGEGRFVHSEHGPMSWNDAQPRSIMGRVVELSCTRP